VVSHNDLLHFLQAVQQQCGGVIPIERFMKEALYHPVFGYYSSRIHNVGAKGDFSTSATLDPHLGKAIAHWIANRAKALGWKSIPIIEVGAGSGLLALSILRHSGWIERWRSDYMICEASPILRARQKENLRWHGVHWIKDLQEGLERSGGRALIFSNELVDAFPCRVFQKTGKGWDELGIIIHPDGSLSETPANPATQDSWFEKFSDLKEGQRVERHDSYLDWLRNWNSLWKEGRLLTIDYGNLREGLYSGHPEGSLRAYWKHQRYTGLDLYARFGKQDLTADVNFSDLIAWGKSFGWREISFMTQRAFLKQWIPTINPDEAKNRFLIPDDVGDVFKVLEQCPGEPQ
jgi:SAM-dependent MidA family methyltransferase